MPMIRFTASSRVASDSALKIISKETTMEDQKVGVDASGRTGSPTSMSEAESQSDRLGDSEPIIQEPIPEPMLSTDENKITTTTIQKESTSADGKAAKPTDHAASSTSTTDAPTTLSSTTATAYTKSVRFSNIEIREYPITIGDNPGGIVGVPITIDWTPIEDQPMVFPLDEYEETRPEPRSMSELKMPSSYRSDVLRRLGFSRRDIQEGVKAANLARGRRRRTFETMHMASAHEMVERMKRATLNATIRRSAKSQERKLISDFVDIDMMMMDKRSSKSGKSCPTKDRSHGKRVSSAHMTQASSTEFLNA